MAYPSASDHFDVFEFLKITRREDVLHTPMLAGLLDPYGAHGLGDRLLYKFVAAIDRSLVKNWASHDWIVKQQQRVPGGRIDILLLCPNRRVAIAVETKIDAAESKSQLSSYRAWLTSLAPSFLDHHLVFLTLRGTASRILPDGCMPLSYEMVLDLLQQSLVECRPADFDPAVLTYVNLLSRLLGRELPLGRAPTLRAGALINLFRFLRITRNEAVLHTRMLAGLVDPTAPHQQGNRFLASFLRQVLTDHSLVAASQSSAWQVIPEHKIPDGRIDLILRCPEYGILIAIENKVDSAEGPSQLDRYAAWMRKQEQLFPRHTLVFLTIAGSTPVTATQSQPKLLSYMQVLAVIEQSSTQSVSDTFADLLAQYVAVVRSIIPAPGLSVARIGQKLSPSKLHTSAVVEFMRSLVAHWNELPLPGAARPPVLKSLVAHLALDDKWDKYHGIEIRHESEAFSTREQIVISRVECVLSSKSVMGLWVGFHWRNTEVRANNDRWLRLPEGVALMTFAKKFYRVPTACEIGQWIAAMERVEYPRSDGAMVSLLKNHTPDIRRMTVATLCNLWTLFGELLVEFNQRLLLEQTGIAVKAPRLKSAERWIVRCKRCDQRMRVPKNRGNLRVTCPGCSGKFTIAT